MPTRGKEPSYEALPYPQAIRKQPPLPALLSFQWHYFPALLMNKAGHLSIGDNPRYFILTVISHDNSDLSIDSSNYLTAKALRKRRIEHGLGRPLKGAVLLFSKSFPFPLKTKNSVRYPSTGGGGASGGEKDGRGWVGRNRYQVARASLNRRLKSSNGTRRSMFWHSSAKREVL